MSSRKQARNKRMIKGKTNVGSEGIYMEKA